MQNVSLEYLMDETSWETYGIWDYNIKMYAYEVCCGDVYRIHLAQDRDQWWALTKTVKDLRTT
jgi:hypothetical protein